MSEQNSETVSIANSPYSEHIQSKHLIRAIHTRKNKTRLT